MKEKLFDLTLSPLSILVAITIAAISMIGYASNYIYTRSEANLLEKRIDNIDGVFTKRLERIEDKLDRIIESRK